MRTKNSTPVRLMAVAAGGSVIAAMSAFPATAATEGDVEVVNTETVKIYTDATGEVQSKRLYEQLALTGEGTVDITNPVVADGLRNLDGFGGFDVEDGEQVVNLEVDGEENLRSVSNYDGDMPLDITASYVLDGEELDPEDVVGESGELTVTYTVKNVTQKSQLVTFDDGKGGTMSREVEVMMPMVGSLATSLPNNFRNVQSQASMAGDGEGGTKLSFTMTLLAPIGSDTAELSYTADVVDAVIPDASISALPVNPLDVPSFKSAGESYQGGAATGAELANGATTIDSNLLKLRDGASKLLAGMIKLRDGAGELNKGLADTAVPGAMQLAAGADELNTGMGRIYAGTLELSAGSVQLADGTVRLADGSVRLADGTVRLADGSVRLAEGARQLADGSILLANGAGELAAGADRLSTATDTAYEGSEKLTSGLGQISAGLDQLAGTKGLPAAQAGIKQLQAGVAALLAGFGDPSNPSSLIGGLTQLKGGLGQLQTGSGTLVGGLERLAGAEGLAAVQAGVTQLKGQLDGATPTVAGSVDQLIGLASSIATDPACTGVCVVKAQNLAGGLTQLKGSLTTQLGAASGGLAQILGGLNLAIGGLNTQLIPGAKQLQGGLAGAAAGADKLLVGAGDAKGGLLLVQGGLESLSVGIASAVDGVMALSAGAGDAHSGSDALSDGLGQISAGAGELAGGADQVAGGAEGVSDGAGQVAGGAGELSAGAGEVADGAGDLADGAGRLSGGAGQLSDGAGELAEGTGTAYAGSGRLADGAGRLADGLGDAADGSGLLFNGLIEAALGVPKLRDGAQELSDKGTSKLVEAGLSTAQEYGLMYAMLEAGGERADSSKMVAGAPEDAIGLAAYSYEIKGEDGEGGRNLTRGLAGLALLGAGAAAFALRRRFI